jgi:hypothetical protein
MRACVVRKGMWYARLAWHGGVRASHDIRRCVYRMGRYAGVRRLAFMRLILMRLTLLRLALMFSACSWRKSVPAAVDG